MKYKALVLLLAIFSSFLCNAAELNPTQVLDKAVGKLSKASSVNCNFRISADKNNINGSFKSSGSKFTLDSPVSKTWYDGKNMWTANPKSKEITLVNPSTQEIKEANPFAYLNSYKNNYIYAFSKRKENGHYLVVLNPKDKKSQIKAVEVAINEKTFLPERFIIRDRNNKITTILIESLSLKIDNPASAFVCPVSSMQDYEFVDLR